MTITFEVIGIERHGQTGEKSEAWRITLRADGGTIYNHSAYINLSASEARGVAIGDRWTMTPLTLPTRQELAAVADAIAALVVAELPDLKPAGYDS